MQGKLVFPGPEDVQAWPLTLPLCNESWGVRNVGPATWDSVSFPPSTNPGGETWHGQVTALTFLMILLPVVALHVISVERDTGHWEASNALL